MRVVYTVPIMQFTETDLYLNKRIAQALAGLFFVLFLVTFINVIYDWVPSKQNTVVQSVIHVPHRTYQLQDISTWHLMGLSPSSDLPETNLQLTLQGVLTMPNSQRASAIIAGPDEKANVYRPGDLLPGGAILDKVMSDKVIIKNRGKLEELPLVRKKLQFAPVPESMWQ